MSKGEYLGEFEQLVLLALIRLEDKAYGMAVRREIEDRADRDVSIGAVYATLDRLEEKGLASRGLASRRDRGGRAKKCFTITAAGARARTIAAGGATDARRVAGTVEPEPMTPPRIASWLLEASLLSLDGEAIAGDLHEEVLRPYCPGPRRVSRPLVVSLAGSALARAALFPFVATRVHFRASVAIVGAGFTAVVPATLLVMLRTSAPQAPLKTRAELSFALLLVAVATVAAVFSVAVAVRVLTARRTERDRRL